MPNPVRTETELKEAIKVIAAQVKQLTAEKKVLGDELLAISRSKAIAQAERVGVAVGDMYEQRGTMFKITSIYMNSSGEVMVKTRYGQYMNEQTFKLANMNLKNLYRKVEGVR